MLIAKTNVFLMFRKELFLKIKIEVELEPALMP